MTSLGDAIKYAAKARARGFLVGYTAGVFDLLHNGHQRYLAACARLCDTLIVGIDTDAVVRAKKGLGRPIDTAACRVVKVAALRSVAFTFEKEVSADTFLGRLRPSRYFIPDNRHLSSKRYRVLTEVGVELVELPYFAGVSTTKLIQRRTQQQSSVGFNSLPALSHALASYSGCASSRGAGHVSLAFDAHRVQLERAVKLPEARWIE